MSLYVVNGFSDVAYVAASGSIIAAAGCSANGANIVVWDTLAPPVTSQASIVCHEGVHMQMYRFFEMAPIFL